jgi:hypothetical protein
MVSTSLSLENGPGWKLMTRSFAMPVRQAWDTGLPKPVRVLYVPFHLTHAMVSFSLKHSLYSQRSVMPAKPFDQDLTD